MHKSHSAMAAILAATLFGAGAVSAYAQEPTLRSLAEERGRYVGAILNSQWFGGGLPGDYEKIHKTQFNVVVAENEMKFDATEPQEGRFNYGNGDKMVKYAKPTACASAVTLLLGIARSQTG